MPTCKKCGHQNREGTKYCVNCGNVLELTEAYIRKEKAKERTAVKNWVAYFLIFMGFCTLFGGLMTYATSVGTIIEDVTAQVATPYIIIGFVLMLIGFATFLIKTGE